MSLVLRVAAVLALGVGALSPGVLAAGGDPREDAQSSPTIVVGNPALRASLDRIYRGSATWRAELDRVAQSGRRIVVLTADQVVVSDGGPGAEVESFDPGVLAEVSVIAGSGSRVDAVLVAVNLTLLNEAHHRLGSTWSQRDADLDRILVHEVYGHALPYVVAGDVSGRCADPAKGERAVDACAIRRENAVRAELGLGRRADPGLMSLALARY
jgi:hypothetical protein